MQQVFILCNNPQYDYLSFIVQAPMKQISTPTHHRARSSLQFNQFRPRALDSFAFIVCFLSRDERAPAALYDEVVGAPIAPGCLRAWLCFCCTGGLDMCSIAGTSLNSVSIVFLRCLLCSPCFLFDSVSIRRPSSARTKAVSVLDGEASSAIKLWLDMIAARLSSAVDICFAGTQTRSLDIAVANCCSCSFGGCFQNGSTT